MSATRPVEHLRAALQVSALFLCLTGAAQADPVAFPGAMGFGATATGGRGGAVVQVTTLSGHGKGSLRWALEEVEGPKIVVFKVGGVIHLSDEIHVGDNVTILGQTAPGDGITLIGARMSVTGSNVILRGLRVRPGKGDGQDLDARDSISVGNASRTVSRVIIDHNSVSWATDENMSTWYDVSDLTFSNNIIAEALLDAGHSEGRHSMGLLIGKTSRRVSVLRNLFLSNFWRNPQVEMTEGTEIINNLMVNFGPGGVLVSQGPSVVDIIGNVLVAGADTPDVQGRPAIELKADEAGTAYFVQDNQTPTGVDALHGLGAALVGAGRVVADSRVTDILPSTSVAAVVLASAGARVPALDPVDSRLVADATSGEARVRNKSWPGQKWRPEKVTAAAQDSDDDGLPDAEEVLIGTDPALADSDRIDPASGYAYIELYANALFGG